MMINACRVLILFREIPSSGNFKEKGKAIYLSKGFDRIMTQARTLSVISETVVID